MKLKNIKLIALLLLCAGYIMATDGLGGEAKKEYSETFTIKENALLKIVNRYGYVNIQVWDQQTTQIDVKVLVKAKNDTKASELLDRININFSNSAKQVSVETDIDSGESDGWNYNVNYEINYDVFMPRNVFLDLTNKYGDSSVESLDKDIKAWVKYGDLNLQDQTGNLDLYLGYGKLIASNLADVTAEIKYSSTTFANAGNIILETKYSKHRWNDVGVVQVQSGYDGFQIHTATSINNDGKYDTWKVTWVGDVVIDNKYADYKFGTVTGKVSTNQKYGRVRIDLLENHNQLISFDTKYVDLNVGELVGDFDIALSGRYISYELPESLSYQVKEDDGKDTTVRASRGGKGLKIKAAMEYGRFSLN